MTLARGSILFALLAAALWIVLPVQQAANLPSTGLMGVVKSAQGTPLEGVAVSARLSGQSFTTSVFTDHDGEYYFPALTDGRYRVWAQAVGFDMARGEVAVSSGKKIEQNFSMAPRKDFYKQLSSTEWAESLPGDTPEDQRMKDLVHNNCTLCHLTGFIMAKRFDAAGWATILDTMINHRTEPNTATRRLLTTYKDELVSYLARVRGPDPDAMKFKALPRTTGEANQIVVTEYEIPRGDTGTYSMSPDGSDWSEGIASGFGRISGGVLHDSVAAKDGNVYFSDNTFPERTIGRLDPRTGRVTSFKLDDGKGIASRTHGAIPDRDGNVWFNNGSDGTIIKFDPATESFTRYPKPPGGLTAGGHIEVDSKGNIFTSAPNTGVVKLDPKTGKYTDYKAITPRGNPYGIAVDSEDNAWMAQLAGDRLMVVNGRNGEVGEVVLPRLPGVGQKDVEIGERDGAAGNAAPLYFKGPRRLGGDPKGDSVWVAEFWAGKLARINIRTREIKEYSLPSKYSHPYDVQVDKNQMVWINLMNSDRVAKFNPFTEEFTEYPLPSRGTETRHISVDDSTNPPTIWLAESGLAKIARVQFRTNTAARSTVAAK
jgi:streptogramin lyase